MKNRNHHLSMGQAPRRQLANAVPSSSCSQPAPGGSGPDNPGLHYEREPSTGWQMVIFVTLILSIIASRFIDYYRAGVSWNLFRDWQYLLFAIIVSLLAFPVVYRKIQHSRNEPILVQIGVIFTVGMGWEKMLSSVVDALKPVVLARN